MSKKAFEKFINKEPKASVKKEAFRQEKRKAKASARAAGEEARRIKLEKKQGIVAKNKTAKNYTHTAKFKKENANFNTTQLVPQTQYKIVVKNNFEPMPLNKFIAHCGVCGRREAAELVKKGWVIVNGDKILEPSFRVMGNEDIKVKDK